MTKVHIYYCKSCNENFGIGSIPPEENQICHSCYLKENAGFREVEEIKYLTIGELKKLIINIPDNVKIFIPLDSGDFAPRYIEAKGIRYVVDGILEIR